jgi:hypothetical protein
MISELNFAVDTYQQLSSALLRSPHNGNFYIGNKNLLEVSYVKKKKRVFPKSNLSAVK